MEADGGKGLSSVAWLGEGFSIEECTAIVLATFTDRSSRGELPTEAMDGEEKRSYSVSEIGENFAEGITFSGLFGNTLAAAG